MPTTYEEWVNMGFGIGMGIFMVCVFAGLGVWMFRQMSDWGKD